MSDYSLDHWVDEITEAHDGVIDAIDVLDGCRSARRDTIMDAQADGYTLAELAAGIGQESINRARLLDWRQT